ncbi:MAG: hypothetical protein RDA78_07865 [Roseibium sp.]|uniref:hypothetical protein n=1 Tax=Roseibium sp. TaxID=1936156 RepID=UPI003D9C5AB0
MITASTLQSRPLAQAASSGPVPALDAGEALAVCAGNLENSVPLVAGGTDWTFEDADGGRYLAAELRPLTDDVSQGPGAIGYKKDETRLFAVPVAGPNRWGQVPAWIVGRNGQREYLLQARLLERGQALFAPGVAAGDCADRLRAAERSARTARIGGWTGAAGVAVFSSVQPDAFTGHEGRYVIARGRLVSLGKTAATRYLNFGRHWKTDLTATFKSAEEDTFNAALRRNGHTVGDLEGCEVEVRGVLQEWDGPYIALQHPEQLVVIEGKRAGRGGQNGN